jgi:MYXO-CTERM domain-containing protein
MEQVSHVSFADALLQGTGNRIGVGMRVAGSQFVTVRDNRFDNLQNGLVKGGVTDGLVTRNQWLNGGEDGMKLVNSQRMIVSHNLCAGYAPQASYHPDCIQTWYTTGKPPQSDIFILNNVAIGPQQGFTSFDPESFSGTRLTFAGNFVASTMPHSITCAGCTNSQFFDNMLIALPDAKWRTFLRAPGTEAGNVFSNNRVLDLRGQFDAVLPDPVFTTYTPHIAGLVGSRWDDRSFGLLLAASPSGAPEPQGWIMLITGFGLIGLIRRRRSSRKVALHQHDVEPSPELLANLLQQAGSLEPACSMQPDRRLVG